jgi:DNA-binding PadR family transcriptional regulator
VPHPEPRDLKPNHYYILLCLAGGDRHGLAIAREVKQLSERRVRLWPATLYGALEDLRERGWIEELEAGQRPAEESEKKRIYRLTRSGRAMLAAQTDRLAALVRVARSRVKSRAGESA